MSHFLHWFLSIYALLKDFLGIQKGALRTKSWPMKVAIQTFLLIMTTFLFILQLILCLPAQILHVAMDLYLKRKWGDNYGGLLKGQDSQLDCTDEKIAINVVVILNSTDDAHEVVTKLVKLGQTVHASVYKLSCTVKKLLGYSYYVKNYNRKEDCTEVVTINGDEYITRDTFLDYLHEVQMANPLNGERVWYVKIFAQPIRWSSKSKTTKQYALLLVFRHCVADGVALIGLLKNFMIRETNPDQFKLAQYTTKPNFSLDDVYIYKNPFTAKFDAENVEIKEGSSRQVAFFVEEEIKYVPLVKKLKNKLKVGFTEILLVGLTASMSEYAKKRGKTIDSTSVGVLCRPINSDLESIINCTYNYDNLSNDSSVVMINSPVNMKEGSTLVDRVNSIHKELELAKYAMDGLLIYTMTTMGHLLPARATEALVHYMSDTVTAGITNVGGLKGGTIAGYEVETALSFIPNFFNAAFRLSVFTKGDCFMLALAAKENVVYSRNELQEILNNVFKYIEALDEEIKDT